MITAPFNFVPLNEKVFFPLWAEDVSHDIPFEDGESGVIDITITAKSPIFIRDHEKPEEFCQHNGQYYIPGSSIKGMVRNVLEIMSFAKLNENQYTDNTYAVRDLSRADNFYMKQMSQLNNTTYCGWLKKTDDGYVIEDCGKPGRIAHSQIDRALNIDFASHFTEKGFEKTSEYKYKLVGGVYKKVKVGEPFVSKTNPKYDKRIFYKYDKNGQEATLVLTGQPTPRKNTGKMGDGKGYEFLFFESKNEYKVSPKVFENFKFAYFDGRDTEPQESPDWKFWKEKLYNGEKVPVFFQKSQANVIHFGISYLYKLPYTHSVADGIYENHIESPQLDFPQTIFGHIDKNGKKSLKGRVQFSHFKAVANVNPLRSRTEVLGTPRASYYPIYIRQKSTAFTTYMDTDFHIAGRKRYPIHRGGKTTQTEDTGNKNVGTTFQPLKEGVVFKGKLRYHNLKKAELGAILSVLTFHNTPNAYHNIGMAKSLGYGKISVQIDGIEDIQPYLKAYELTVSEQIENWQTSTQLIELLTMAMEQNNAGSSKLYYMSLTEFAKNKNRGKADYLKLYSELDNIQAVKPQSLLTEEERQKLKQNSKEIQRAFKERQERQKKQEEQNNSYEIVSKSENIDQIKAFLTKYPDSQYKAILEEKIEELSQKIEAKKADKHKELNEKVKRAFDELQKKKSNQKQYQKELGKFVKKWEASKNNKGSEFILDLVEKAKQEMK